MLTLCLLSVPAFGADFRVLRVRYADGLHVDLQALVRAPVRRTAPLLDDYDALARLVPIVTEARRLPGGPPGAQRVRTRMAGCVWFACVSLINVIDVVRLGPGSYRAVTVPALSDFAGGEMTWSYEASGRNTLLRFHARLEPTLWLPPLLGPYLVELKVRSQLIQGVRHLEAAARGRHLAAPSRPPGWPLAGEER